MVAVNLATKQTKNLGVNSNFKEDATIRQSDGYVISYSADGSPSVVMARNYVLQKGQEGIMGSEAPPISLGVDRIALDTMKVTRIEAPNPLVENLLTEPMALRE